LFFMFTRIRWLLTAVVLTAAVALVVFVGAGLAAGPLAGIWPVSGQVSAGGAVPGAVLREENCYLCGDVELVYQAPAPADMLGRDVKDLQRKYPARDGWTVEVPNEKLLVLKKSIDGFCGQHSLYRHLGIHRDRLAVYQGPLGLDQRLLRVEEKKVDNLPRTLREKLYRSRDYNRLPTGERSDLRTDLEFIDENALNSALENLDEIPEQKKS